MADKVTATGTEMLFNAHFLHDQVFWTAVSFILLLIVLLFKVLPELTRILDERAAKIRADLDTAESSRVQAEKLKAQYDVQLQQAREEAAQIVSQSRVEAKKIVDQRLAELEQEINKRRDDAHKAIALAQDKALQDLRGDIAKLLISATEQVITTKLSAKDAESLTDAAIKGLRH